MCQEVAAALSGPLAGPPALVTFTLVILPCAAATVIPLLGLAPELPFAGVMDSCPLAACEWPGFGAWPAFVPPPAAEEQAAASRATMAQAATVGSHRRCLDEVPIPGTLVLPLPIMAAAAPLPGGWPPPPACPPRPRSHGSFPDAG